MENKNCIWRPVSEYTGGRVLATNGLDVIIGEINSEGDCESEDYGCTILCGITGFIKIEEMLPELKKDEGERIRKALIQIFNVENFENYDIKNEEVIAWLEKQGEHAKFRDSIQVGDKVTRNQDGMLVNLSQLNRVAKKDEKQGENNMGISEATKQKLEDNLNKALEKETPESWNEFLDEQKPAEWSEENEANLNESLSYIKDDALKEFIKSLKERYTWKPSEEMLEALYRAVPENVKEMSEDEMLLDKLYQGLKYGRVLSEN